ncbi:hypothetical protein PsYK624_117260 [Phanerochaete sordida]|uniref:Uncharacterized protein n=1 Tax=Phanerochaete sordida TaxID=48140 RepID=A0A9P3GI75_9APHY|nr:hypothetical protein PsYK624_117260 [Phanerochaete sordida]
MAFSTGGRRGVHLQAALRLPIHGLDAAYSVQNVAWDGHRAGLHILWPGYSAWSLSDALTSHAKYGGQQTLAGLANQVARSFQQFYNDVQATELIEHAWRLQNVPFENLYLVELRMVTRSSWQPIICARLR